MTSESAHDDLWRRPPAGFWTRRPALHVAGNGRQYEVWSRLVMPDPLGELTQPEGRQ